MTNTGISFGRVFLPLLAGAAALLAACTNAPSAPTPTASYSQTDLRVGTGTQAASGMQLTVNYTGWLYDASKPDFKGLQFDTSTGRSPFTFTLGTGSVIQGWDRGLVGMQVGGIRRLVVPPSLAYGNTRSGPIPPYATLIFDVELLSAQ